MSRVPESSNQYVGVGKVGHIESDHLNYVGVIRPQDEYTAIEVGIGQTC
jgi:hypothetical protein